MDSVLLIIWVIIAVISIAYYFVSNSNAEPEEDEDEQEKFPAITIVVDEAEACPSVLKLVGQRLLSDEAPLLPLIDCTSAECTCKYRHYVDRRGGSRRGDEKSVIKRCYGGSEKRVAQRGRRASDFTEDTIEQPEEEMFETHADTYYDYVDRTGLFKAMAAKEAADSSENSSDHGRTESDDPDQATITAFKPASNHQNLAVPTEQKKSGRSRSS